MWYLRGAVWAIWCMVLYGCMLIQRCMVLYVAVWLYGARREAGQGVAPVWLYEKMYCPLLYGRIQRLCAAELAALAPFATRRMMAPVWFR